MEELPPDPEAGLAAWRLSRHFTSACQLGPDFMRGGGLVHAFADVVHCASIEGSATLAGAGTTFLATGLRNRMRTSYLPLVILAYHEHIELLDIAQNISRRRREQMARLMERFLDIRLRLRLPVFSDITAHNQFYDILRHGLQIDALTLKLAQDAAEAERALASRAREADRRAWLRSEEGHRRRERRYAPWIGLLAGLLAFLTTLTCGEGTS